MQRSAVLSPSVVSDSLRLYGLQPTRLLCPCRFSRQEYWSELPCPRPGDLPNPGIEPGSPSSQAESLTYNSPGKPQVHPCCCKGQDFLPFLRLKIFYCVYNWQLDNSGIEAPTPCSRKSECNITASPSYLWFHISGFHKPWMLLYCSINWKNKAKQNKTCISEPAQFKCMLFKGQLCIHFFI